jgi:hypothetical protein
VRGRRKEFRSGDAIGVKAGAALGELSFDPGTLSLKLAGQSGNLVTK